MTKKHSTKKALMASALSLLLCFSMLIGTTFAWFLYYKLYYIIETAACQPKVCHIWKKSVNDICIKQ